MSFTVELKTRYLPAQEYQIAIVGTYADGSPFIQIFTEAAGLWATPTCAFEAASPPANSAWIKDYSEHEGMVSALTSAGLIGPPNGFIQSSFVEIQSFPLTNRLLTEWENYLAKTSI